MSKSDPIAGSRSVTQAAAPVRDESCTDLPADFAQMLAADFKATASLVVQEAQRKAIEVHGRDAEDQLICLFPDGRIEPAPER